MKYSIKTLQMVATSKFSKVHFVSMMVFVYYVLLFCSNILFIHRVLFEFAMMLLVIVLFDIISIWVIPYFQLFVHCLSFYFNIFVAIYYNLLNNVYKYCVIDAAIYNLFHLVHELLVQCFIFERLLYCFYKYVLILCGQQNWKLKPELKIAYSTEVLLWTKVESQNLLEQSAVMNACTNQYKITRLYSLRIRRITL